MRTPSIHVTINLDEVRAVAEQIRTHTGVGLIAVIKADAYGLGAPLVADTLASVVDDFAYFTVEEARAVRRPGLVLGPPLDDPNDYQQLVLRPAIASLSDVDRFADQHVAIKVDTGMQRFGAAPEQIDELSARCEVSEYFAHAVTESGTEILRDACAGRGKPLHAAPTCLLDNPKTWFDAVRPGLALYRRAIRVTTKLQLVRDTIGPIGYTGFHAPRVGVILGGYSNGLSPAPVLINSRRQRLLEIGMNTSFVSVDPGDKTGDEVILLGAALSTADLAAELNVREHEVLCRYCGMGPRTYVTVGAEVTTD